MASLVSSSGIAGLNAHDLQAKMEGSALQDLGCTACAPKNIHPQKGQALHLSCAVSAPLFECPAFDDIRRAFQHLSYDSHGAMRLLMWHPCQKDVASCLPQLFDRSDENLT